MVAIVVLLLSVALLMFQGGIRAAFRSGGTCVDNPSAAGCMPQGGGGGPGSPGGPSSTSTTTTTTTLPG